MIKHMDTRPIPDWIKEVCAKKGIAQSWVWIYVDIKAINKCWNYVGSVNSEGYGRFRYHGRAQVAHRVVYCIHNHLKIEDFDKTGLVVRHKCDNTSCCNPYHLESGTRVDNNKDRHERTGYLNAPRGEAHLKSKLTEIKVRRIRRNYSSGGWTHKRLAEKYKVSPGTITAILTGRNWAWLD